jgi:hypothetical protein
MKTQEIRINETRFPALTRAVIEQIGDRDSLADVVRHGAAGGFCGFTYYTDTLKFFRDNREEIKKLVEQTAKGLGESSFAMVKNFNCLRDCGVTVMEVATVLFGGFGEIDECNEQQIENALAWFALEEIARELNPDV